MRVRILYHDHCFDGAASAAYFSRFLRDTQYPDAEYVYTGLAHVASQSFAESLFDGDVNAIVDFKYATSPRLTWWFDHHLSAFLSPEDHRHFDAQADPRKMYDTSFKSCTKYIATTMRSQYGYDPADLRDLVKWADIVDGAQYKDPQEAVGLTAPATQLVLVIENSHGSDTVQHIIRSMQTKTLEAIIAEPEIQALYQPLYENHLRSMGIIQEAAHFDRGVVFFDVVEQGLASYNKFIPYYLFNDSVYTVSVSVSTYRAKVSVGSNPWLAEVPHNLAKICERYGGGGHARVGAISFPTGAVAEARQAAAEIAAELRSAF